MDTQTLPHVALFDKCRQFTKADEIQAAGLYPYFKPISESEDTVVVIEGQKRIMLGSNNYLGLTHHPKVLEAAEPRAAPLRLRLHRQPLPQRHARPARAARGRARRVPRQGRLPRLLHRLQGQPRPDLRPGRQGRRRLPRQARPRLDRRRRQAVATARPGASTTATWPSLERKLARDDAAGRGRMIVVDGVYSMEGDIADVPGSAALARKHGAALAVDDAHALGVLGPNGDGTAAHFGMTDEVDLIAGTFSKSLASIGGFVAGREQRHPLPASTTAGRSSSPRRCRPANTAGVLAALEVMQDEPERREPLWANTRRLQEGFRDLGFDIGPTETPIVPVLIGPLETTFLFWRQAVRRRRLHQPGGAAGRAAVAVPPAHQRHGHAHRRPDRLLPSRRFGEDRPRAGRHLTGPCRSAPVRDRRPTSTRFIDLPYRLHAAGPDLGPAAASRTCATLLDRDQEPVLRARRGRVLPRRARRRGRRAHRRHRQPPAQRDPRRPGRLLRLLRVR